MPSSRALQCHLCSSPCAADLHSSNWEEGSSEAGDSLSCSGVLRFPSYCNHLPRAKAEGQGCSSVPAALLKVWITEQTSECDLSKEQSSVPVSSAQRLGLLLAKHSSVCRTFWTFSALPGTPGCCPPSTYQHQSPPGAQSSTGQRSRTSWGHEMSDGQKHFSEMQEHPGTVWGEGKETKIIPK